MKTKELSTGSSRSWARRIRAHWPEIRVVRMQAIPGTEAGAGETATLHVRLHLGALTPADVRVELTVGGPFVARDPSASAVRLRNARSHDDGDYTFEAELPSDVLDGALGFTVRVVPDSRRGAVVLAPVMRTAYRGRARPAIGRRRDALPYGYVAITARRRSVARTDGGRV